jgi:hypothetical protein
MEINIDELQLILSQLLSRLKEIKGTHIELNNDFYWDIPSEELYNPYQEPKELTLGKLSDDWQEIKRLTDNQLDAIPYDLKRISNILKALSIENPIAF